MQVFKTGLAITALCAATIVPTFAQQQSLRTNRIEPPQGVFVDEYGTSFTFSACGEGTALCGVLNDIQGNSRTEENLAYVGQQVMQAQPTGPNTWEGTVIFDGKEAKATITQTGPDTVEIQGCRAAILCQTLVFNKAS